MKVFTRTFMVLAGVVLLLSSPVIMSTGLFAGDAAVLSSLKPALDKAIKSGSTVIIVSPNDAAKTAKETSRIVAFKKNMLRARSEFRRIASKAPALPGKILATLNSKDSGGSILWLLYAVATAVAGILIGLWVKAVIGRKAGKYLSCLQKENPKGHIEQFPFLAFRAFIMAIESLALFLVAVGFALVVDFGNEAARNTILTIVLAYTAFRLLRWSLHFNLIAPDVPKYRMINLSDSDARSMFRHWSLVDALAVFMFSVCAWMFNLGLDHDAHALLLTGAITALVMMLAITITREKKAITGIILGGKSAAEKPLWRRIIATVWFGATLIYLIPAGLVSVGRVLLNKPSAIEIVLAPFAVIFLAIVVYTALVVMMDKFFAARLQKKLEEFNAEVKQIDAENAIRLARAEELKKIPENLDEDYDHAALPDPVEYPLRPVESEFEPLLKQAISLIVTIVAIVAIASMWGADFSNSSLPLTRFINSLVVLFAGYLAYNGIKIWIDTIISREEPEGEDHELGGVPGGSGVSRIATLLPIFRNFLLIATVVITGMIFLSDIGLDITPLFAGAGVVGLAIGFGAQTLIRDIFSGAFFLMDDAFRRGEYIDIGTVKGTVEKISIRSMQLRHHNGPLNTVPFGEISQLTNYSRDWAIMKLSLRLTYDTDADKVRKMIKKLGQEMLDHPEIGHLFLQPLKSQGVRSMEDSAMIMRVKFTTKPGDQFIIRRFVLDEIRKLFDANGIKFANREVTVHVADKGERDLTGTEEKAAAGAAGRLIQSPDENPGAAKPGAEGL